MNEINDSKSEKDIEQLRGNIVRFLLTLTNRKELTWIKAYGGGLITVVDSMIFELKYNSMGENYDNYSITIYIGKFIVQVISDDPTGNVCDSEARPLMRLLYDTADEKASEKCDILDSATSLLYNRTLI